MTYRRSWPSLRLNILYQQSQVKQKAWIRHFNIIMGVTYVLKQRLPVSKSAANVQCKYPTLNTTFTLIFTDLSAKDLQIKI